MNFADMYNSGQTFSFVVPDLYKQLEAEPNPVKHHYIKSDHVKAVKAKIAQELGIDINSVALEAKWEGKKCYIRKRVNDG